jgi:hypothetical protein
MKGDLCRYIRWSLLRNTCLADDKVRKDMGKAMMDGMGPVANPRPSLTLAKFFTPRVRISVAWLSKSTTYAIKVLHSQVCA